MDNVTIRNKIQKSNSDPDMNSTMHNDTLWNSTMFDSSAHSLPTAMMDTSQLNELQEQMKILKHSLDSANLEIEKLLLENHGMKSLLEEKNREIEVLKKIVTINPGTPAKIHTPKNYNKEVKLKTLPHSTPRRSRRRRHLLDASRDTPIPNQSTSMSINVHQEDDMTTSKPERTMIPQTSQAIMGCSKPTNDSEMHTKKSRTESNSEHTTMNSPAETKPKRKVIILADQQGRHTQGILQKLLGQDFLVTCSLKPQAKIIDVVNAEIEEIAKLSKNDFVILICGANDRNPNEFLFELRTWLRKVQNTNVIIPKVAYSRHLNEDKLNYEVKFVLNEFLNSTFVDVKFRNNTQRSPLFLCRSILRDLLRINYRIKYDEYVGEAKQIHDCRKSEDKFTQTDFTCNTVQTEMNDNNNVSNVSLNDVANENCIRKDFFRE